MPRPVPSCRHAMSAGGGTLVVEGRVEMVPHAANHSAALDDVSLKLRQARSYAWRPKRLRQVHAVDIVAGLTKADAGRVLADGKPVEGPTGAAAAHGVSGELAVSWLDVFGQRPVRPRSLPRAQHTRARGYCATGNLAMVGLEKFERAHVHELSEA